MRLIGINGFKESGKDTTFELIKEAAHSRAERIGGDTHRVQRAGFADNLKLMAAHALGFTELDVEAATELMNVAKEKWRFDINHPAGGDSEGFVSVAKFTGREYLQWFGGEARKVFGDSFWIDQVLPPFPVPGNRALHRMELEAKYPDVNTLVITDVRYPNEAERVKELDGEIWEIVKPDLESDGHASEQPLPRELVDLTIINDGSIEDLHRKVEAAL